MRRNPTVLEQVVEQFPWEQFGSLVRKHGADDRQRGFTSRQHFLALLGGALGGHQGLRSTVSTLAPNSGALHPMGGKKAPRRSTLADANRDRPAELFFDLLLALLNAVPDRTARRGLKQAVRLIDATHIDLGPRMERWCGLYQGRAAAKIHMVYDPAAQRPVFFEITEAKVNDITAAKDVLPIAPNSTYVFDLGYYDFAWWAELARRGCVFVTRLKSNTQLRNVTERALAPSDTLLADREGYLPERLAGSRQNPFAQKGREVVVRITTGKLLRLFTNDLTSPAEDIAALYKERWQIELFFRWIKQNLRITRFMGTSENAIRIQIAVAFIAYVLVGLIQDAGMAAGVGKVPPAATVLLIVQAHVFDHRPIRALLDPTWRPPPPPPTPPGPLLALCT